MRYQWLQDDLPLAGATNAMLWLTNVQPVQAGYYSVVGTNNYGSVTSSIAALAVIDAAVRLLPGVMGKVQSGVEESFESGLLEYPHYTRPAEYRGWRVPDILVSGDHAKVARWRRQQALQRTRRRRPDLLDRASLSDADRKLLGD